MKVWNLIVFAHSAGALQSEVPKLAARRQRSALLESGAGNVLDAQHETADSAAEKLAKNSAEGNWQDANWFNAFDQAESTYNDDADFGRASPPDSLVRQLQDGWQPQLGRNLFPEGHVDPAWFHESPSGGSRVAWQSHFPPATAGLASRRNDKLPTWPQSIGGRWHQDFKTTGHYNRDGLYADGNLINRLTAADAEMEALPAGWFDASVDQMDSFGRPKFPDLGTAQSLVGLGWKEQAVNTTMSCKVPGCTARVSLQAFDSSKQRAAHCRFSIDVKPTDYDDFESGKWIDFISINGVNVAVKCKPKAQGCNSTFARRLYPCVTELDLDTIMSASGTLVVGAKISEYVDECPLEGNYLYAVPQVTCLVQDLPDTSSVNYQPNQPQNGGAGLLGSGINGAVLAGPHGNILITADPTKNTTTAKLLAQAPVQCVHRNCSATVQIPLNRGELVLKDCTMDFKVNSTDYDNSAYLPGAPLAVVEYVKANGAQLTANAYSKLNPCVAAQQGLPPQEKMFLAVNAKNFAVGPTDDFVEVEAKISRFVDECPSQGYLLDAIAEVSCNIDMASLANIAGQELYVAPAPAPAPFDSSAMPAGPVARIAAAVGGASLLQEETRELEALGRRLGLKVRVEPL